MFDRLVLHATGDSAAILWGYRQAVVLKSWQIAKVKGKWTLRGAVQRVDAFQARQRPLLFTAPRPKGYWAWPIETLDLGPSQLVATLGPPEQ